MMVRGFAIQKDVSVKGTVYSNRISLPPVRMYVVLPFLTLPYLRIQGSRGFAT